ncbi:hypothetical protein ACFLR1_05215, partial [Bacteroidota bacterium]
SFTKHLIQVFNKHNCSVVGLREADKIKPRNSIFEGHEFEDGIYKANRIITPSPTNEVQSNLEFCSRFVFTPEIFNQLEQIERPKKGVVLLAEVVDKLARNSQVNGVKLDGECFDISCSKSLLFANLSLTDMHCD